MNSYQHVLIDAKTEYTRQLSNILSPRMYEGILSVYEHSRDINEKHGKNEFLKTFQQYLSKIPDWSSETLKNEYEGIKEKSKCDWLDELITAVFVSHTKVLTAIKVGKKDKTIELKIPRAETFIHKCYIDIARQFWKRPDLFYHKISNIDLQKNLVECEQIIEKSLENTIRKLLPVKNILKEYLGDNYEDDLDNDVTSEISLASRNNLQKLVKKELENSLKNKYVENVNNETYSNYSIEPVFNKNENNITLKIDDKQSKIENEEMLIELNNKQGGENNINMDTNEPEVVEELNTKETLVVEEEEATEEQAGVIEEEQATEEQEVAVEEEQAAVVEEEQATEEQAVEKQEVAVEEEQATEEQEVAVEEEQAAVVEEEQATEEQEVTTVKEEQATEEQAVEKQEVAVEEEQATEEQVTTVKEEQATEEQEVAVEEEQEVAVEEQASVEELVEKQDVEQSNETNSIELLSQTDAVEKTVNSNVNDEPAQKIFSLVEVESEVIEDISFFDDAIKY